MKLADSKRMGEHKKAELYKSECVNLCLARHMARVFGQSQSDAIKRCAQAIQRDTRNVKMHQYASMLLSASNGMRVTSVMKLQEGMEIEGVICL